MKWAVLDTEAFEGGFPEMEIVIRGLETEKAARDYIRVTLGGSQGMRYIVYGY